MDEHRDDADYAEPVLAPPCVAPGSRSNLHRAEQLEGKARNASLRKRSCRRLTVSYARPLSVAPSLRINAADQIDSAVEHRQCLIGRLRRQSGDDPSDAHIPVSLREIGILGGAKQRDRHRLGVPARFAILLLEFRQIFVDVA